DSKAPWDAFLQWMSPTAARRIVFSLLGLDRGGPALDVLGRHLSVRREPPILVAPPRYVREVLLPGQERALAQAPVRRRAPRLAPAPAPEPPQARGRTGPSPPGIDEAEEDQVAHENPPVRPESAHQPSPVQAGAEGPDQVRDVRAVKPLALHDESLGPD